MKFSFHSKGVWLEVLRAVTVLSETASVALAFSGHEAVGSALQVVARLASALRRALIDSEESAPHLAIRVWLNDLKERVVRIFRRLTHWQRRFRWHVRRRR
ncbi:hypothetical protein ACIBEH_32775 [Nocardia salmonicida]|uniref:hypothetical protein n=1 Tax=Nocardia salmonicida TaxID=53431 RepID=UPI0037B36797